MTPPPPTSTLFPYTTLFRSPSLNQWLAADATPAPPKSLDERSEEHTSELQSPYDLVCRLLLEKKKSLTLNTLSIVTCPTNAANCSCSSQALLAALKSTWFVY